ncbi:ATP-binding protein [Maliponia aquimaris]|uniref:Serine-protein kinase RsbW n=1 Tax=Maliponia aquimaris TaxID=1673631 RepID=A0A238K637_9RHOB|nr:ATP-binding protein [Maliponia aquimaris]SMX38370.1 serine-protein kinase RsbW [Maliponia aquimaris]
MRAERLDDGTFLVACEIDSTQEDVSATLVGIRDLLADEAVLPPPECSWELVVAEVLNNIVEHAYQDRAGGEIRLRLKFQPDRLTVSFTDFGLPMPDGTLPDGERASLDVAQEDLPEGGFGWFLIRSLSERLEYRHDGASNQLTLTLPLHGACGG